MDKPVKKRLFQAVMITGRHNAFFVSLLGKNGEVYCGFCYEHFQDRVKNYFGELVFVKRHTLITIKDSECPGCHKWVFWRQIELVDGRKGFKEELGRKIILDKKE